MPERRIALLPAMAAIAAAVAAGCGTLERPAEVPPPPATVAGARDASSPSRGVPCSVQQGDVRLCGAATDNYKASFNERPDEPELRTWLAMHEVEVDGVRYAPHAGQELFEPHARVVATDASGKLYVTVEVLSGPGESVQVRTGPQEGLWGVLLQLSDRARLQTEPVRVAVSVAASLAAPPLATTTVEYRHAPELADATSDSLEHNGPGGRWVVAGHVTRTNLELGWE